MAGGLSFGMLASLSVLCLWRPSIGTAGRPARVGPQGNRQQVPRRWTAAQSSAREETHAMNPLSIRRACALWPQAAAVGYPKGNAGLGMVEEWMFPSGSRPVAGVGLTVARAGPCLLRNGP